MIDKTCLTVGSIHDIPIGSGMRVSVGDHRVVIFRETYGHFYAFEDERSGALRGLQNGRIEEGQICLPNGHHVDLHTGKIDHSDRLLRSVLSWVENGLIILSISSLLMM